MPFTQSWLLEDNSEDSEDNDLQWYDMPISNHRRVIKMSLAIVLVGKDGIVMASDSREMAQGGGIDYHRDDVHKLSNLSDYIGVMSVGNFVGFANWLLSYFETEFLPNEKYDSANVKELSVIFSQFLKKEYGIYSKDISPSWLSSNENLIYFVIAGYTKDGQPQIIRVSNEGRRPTFAPELLDEPYYFSGKNSVAYYLVRKIGLKQPIEAMDTELLKRIAILMITETAKVDDHVALPIDMVVIEKGSLIKSIGKDEIARMNADSSFMRLLKDD